MMSQSFSEPTFCSLEPVRYDRAIKRAPSTYVRTLAIITVGHETKGMSATDTIYDDSNVEQMVNLPAEALHRNVDLAVIKADTEGEYLLDSDNITSI